MRNMGLEYDGVKWRTTTYVRLLLAYILAVVLDPFVTLVDYLGGDLSDLAIRCCLRLGFRKMEVKQ